MWAHGWGMAFFPVFGLFWVVFLALVIFGVARWVFWSRRYLLDRYGCGPWGPGNGPMGQGFGAEAILRERLAKGEIDAQEYERLRGVLRKA